MAIQCFNIAEDIADSLCSLPAGSSFNVRVIQTSDHPVTSLTPRRHYQTLHAANTLSRRILILVSQGNCLVAALEAQEFTSILTEIDTSAHPHTAIAVDACIEKLDTSGELSVRTPLVRAMVAGYLYSLRRYCHTLHCPSVGVHLFARSQPEYIFAKSKENPRKHILGDLALVRWWKQTLHYALVYAISKGLQTHARLGSASTATQERKSLSTSNAGNSSLMCPSCTHTTAVANCIVPGSAQIECPWFHCNDSEKAAICAAASAAAATSAASIVSGPIGDADMNSPNACIDNIHNGHALHTISDLADAKIDVDWRWGLPYPLNARAHDCVLQFPDDPLSRLLEAKHTDDWTVSMLLEMVALGEECGSGRRAAYFSVTLPFPSDDNGATANSSSASSDGKDNAEKPALSAEDYDKVLVALFDQDMDFSNTESARISTEKLFDFLDTSNFTRTTATATTKGQIITTAPKKHEAPAPRVNDLTMVIRKKRKTTKQ